MKLQNIKEVNAFIAAVDSCVGDVILKSPYGDSLNLKSKLTQYVAVGKLLEERGENLELFCSNKADEPKFFEFFRTYPSVIE